MQVKLQTTVFAQNIMMALSRLFVFITAALVEICCDIVTDLTVMKGGSISIPCRYNSWQINNSKYLCLCKNPRWLCEKVVETDQPSTSTKYSILDDKLRHVFNVTIRDLTDTDICFLCGASWWSTTKLSLQILSEPGLYVDQQSIIAVHGGSVTVVCHYAMRDNFLWCMFDGQCIAASKQMKNGMEVSINASDAKCATITMKELKQEHSGWYFCQNGDFQMPVNLTVMREVTTTAPTTTPFVTSVTQLPTREPSTTICTNTTVESQPVNFSNAMTTEVNLHPIPTKSHTTVIVIASTAVLILLLFVIAGFAALKMTVCRKRIPTESHTAKGPRTLKGPSVIYSNIFFTKEPSDHNKGPQAVADQDQDVVYSTVFFTEKPSDSNKGPPTVREQDVIYSDIFVTQEPSDNNKGPQAVADQDQDVVYSTVFLTEKPSGSNKGPPTVREQDVIYSNIFVTQEPSDNNKNELSEASVIYDTIVKQDKSQQMTRQAEESVIYSTVSK